MAKKKNKKNVKKKAPKAVKPMGKLSDILTGIYTEVNLATTCNHSCTCCKVAMPQINYSEFINIVNGVWEHGTQEQKVKLLCTSVEYLFRNEYQKWEMDSLVKPCMFLDENNRCSIYDARPLNCRLYGQWPEEIYEARVEKFVKAYEQHGLSRDDIPLSRQCQMVKRVDDSVELTAEVIEGLFAKLDAVDEKVGDFSSLQIKQKENYRTFHDWLLLKVFGEEWLSMLTSFILAADKQAMVDQIEQLQMALIAKYSEISVPDITDGKAKWHTELPEGS